jgi:hypothetical protein
LGPTGPRAPCGRPRVRRRAHRVGSLSGPTEPSHSTRGSVRRSSEIARGEASPI